jgi:hypothetical protein
MNTHGNLAWVATRKGLFRLQRAASGRAEGAWRIAEVSHLAENVSLVLAEPAARGGTVYAALDHGHFGPKLKRSHDGGATWVACAAPCFPPRPEGAAPELDPNGRPLPLSVQRIWALESGSEPGELWCGTIPGALFHSRDGGDSWQFVQALWDHPGRKQWFGGGADAPGIHSICVDPRDGATVLLGVSCGGVWRTRDRGQSFEVCASGMRAEFMPPERQYDEYIQDPHSMARCRAQPDVLWVQHHNGIFCSRDGSASWQEIVAPPGAPSTFGFAVAAHPRDPNTAWFIPAQKDEHRLPVHGQLVVTRTRDGGQSFQALRQGLPQEHAYDIVYRHALAIDDSGERLLFGSTTGGLWLSEDQGDSWVTLSTHLPPIYCVRF